jgi:ribosomal subunit interface protein
MTIKPKVTFRDIDSSPSVEEHIYSKLSKMGLFSKKILFCDVVISGSKHHQHGPENYSTHVKLAIPRKEFVSTQNKEGNLYKSIDDAFGHIRRQLEDHDKKHHGH